MNPLEGEYHNEFNVASNLEKMIGYGSMVTETVPDDAVTSALRKLVKRWSETISMWLLSFILVMLLEIMYDHLPAWGIIFFVPMWYGSGIQVVASIYILKDLCQAGSKTVQRSDVERLRDNVRTKFVEHDSLMLMRKIFLYGLLSVLYAFFAILSQIMIYLWLVSGAIGMWQALIPVIIVALCFLAYTLLVRTCSVITASLYVLSLISLILYGLKINHELGAGWNVVVIPMFAMEGIIGVHILEVVFRIVSNEIIPSTAQRTSLMHACLGLLLSISGTAITAKYGDKEEDSPLYSSLPKFLWLMAIVMFTVVGLRVFNLECSRLADVRGHDDPTPLQLSEEGVWEATSELSHFESPIIGSIPYRPRGFGFDDVGWGTQGVNLDTRDRYGENTPLRDLRTDGGRDETPKRSSLRSAEADIRKFLDL